MKRRTSSSGIETEAGVGEDLEDVGRRRRYVELRYAVERRLLGEKAREVLVGERPRAEEPDDEAELVDVVAVLQRRGPHLGQRQRLTGRGDDGQALQLLARRLAVESGQRRGGDVVGAGAGEHLGGIAHEHAAGQHLFVAGRQHGALDEPALEGEGGEGADGAAVLGPRADALAGGARHQHLGDPANRPRIERSAEDGVARGVEVRRRARAEGVAAAALDVAVVEGDDAPLVGDQVRAHADAGAAESAEAAVDDLVPELPAAHDLGAHPLLPSEKTEANARRVR